MSTAERTARRLQIVAQAQEPSDDLVVAGSPQFTAGCLVHLAAVDPRPGAVADALLVAATEQGGGGVRYALEAAEALARIAAASIHVKEC